VADQKKGPEPNRNTESDKLGAVHQTVTKLANQLEFAQINDYVQLMNRPWKIMYMNFLGGIARGIGIAIGFTIFASTIVYALQALGALDLPIIGNYIADIVKHVQNQLEGTRYY
jgi:hypothetical protein